jgi:hypothetical protein
MPSRAVRERLAQDVALWQADGLISAETAGLLRQRYDVPGFGFGTLVRYLAIGAGVLIVFGLLGFLAAVAGSAVVVFALLFLPVAFALAYRYSLTFLLVLALIALFHWIGSWTAMISRSTYAISVQEPRVMAVAALLAILVGVGHEGVSWRWPRFHHAWRMVGLGIWLERRISERRRAGRGQTSAVSGPIT